MDKMSEAKTDGKSNAVLKNKEIIHIAVEVICFLGLSYYFSRRINTLNNKVDLLVSKIEEQQTVINKHEEIIMKLIEANGNIFSALNSITEGNVRTGGDKNNESKVGNKVPQSRGKKVSFGKNENNAPTIRKTKPVVTPKQNDEEPVEETDEDTLKRKPHLPKFFKSFEEEILGSIAPGFFTVNIRPNEKQPPKVTEIDEENDEINIEENVEEIEEEDLDKELENELKELD